MLGMRLAFSRLVARLICDRADHRWGTRDGLHVCRLCNCVGVEEAK